MRKHKEKNIIKSIKFISILPAMILTLSLCIPASADGEELLTRGEFVIALFHLSGVSDMEPKESPFDDVDIQGDLTQAVLWAADKGISRDTATESSALTTRSCGNRWQPCSTVMPKRRAGASGACGRSCWITRTRGKSPAGLTRPCTGS